MADENDDRPTPSPDARFDEGFAAQLVGRTLLVGITENDHNGRLIRRHQVFGVVTKAVLDYGICVKRGWDVESKARLYVGSIAMALVVFAVTRLRRRMLSGAP